MEYANIRIFRLNKELPIDERKVNEEIVKYQETGKMSNIVVDHDYNILSNVESYIAGKRLRLKYLESSRIKSMKKLDDKFPAAFLIELTNRCNLNCIMCPRNQLERPPKDMGADVFKKLIDEISEHKIDGLWLYNIGESMIHPDFFDMLDYLKKYPGIKPIWLSTNGTTLTNWNVRSLLGSKLDFLNFSLNAMDKKTHQNISRVDNYEMIMNNVSRFMKMKKKMGLRKPFFRVQIIDMPEMHNKIDKFIKKWGPKADIISVNKLEKFVGQKEIPTNKDIEDFDSGVCKRIDRGIMYIFSDNTVGICATDFNCKNCIGDVTYHTIEEIWTGKSYKQLYDDIKNERYGRMRLCKDCHDRHLA
jgi:wyosine [tRNA(Phe)-imidazoG37] synthetase (radical SAM superfamily)